MGLLEDRRNRARDSLAALKADLDEAAALVASKACVCVTGSYGRGEASPYSDLDFFVITRDGLSERQAWSDEGADLTKSLCTAARRQGLPISDGTDGFALVHSVDGLIRNLGRAEDDATNSLTARLLLLLESTPLLEDSVYWSVIEAIIRSYWRDFEGREREFVPAFLVNDILRLWRTFCVNYEARTVSDPPEKKAKRTLKNYKLKHSRLMTCYSALAELLAVYRANGTVSPADVLTMVGRSPLERLDWIGEARPSARSHVDVIRSRYERFLGTTDNSERELVERLLSRDERKRLLREAKELGDAVYTLVAEVGGGSELHRILVV